jgi:hypothetical protein
MMLHRRVNLGGYQSMEFVSSEHTTVQECARDLITQMNPMSGSYPTVRGVISELQKFYNV